MVFTLEDEYGSHYEIVKTDQTFEWVMDNPMHIEVTGPFGDNISLHELLELGEETRSLIMFDQKSEFESAWNKSKVGEILRTSGLI